MSTTREMTLDEYLSKLSPFHAARKELDALRAEVEQSALGRALYDALTEDSARWVRTDGKENKLAVAVANYAVALEEKT